MCVIEQAGASVVPWDNTLELVFSQASSFLCPVEDEFSVMFHQAAISSGVGAKIHERRLISAINWLF